MYLAGHEVHHLQESDSGAEHHVVGHPVVGDLAGGHGADYLTALLQEHKLTAGIRRLSVRGAGGYCRSVISHLLLYQSHDSHTSWLLSQSHHPYCCINLITLNCCKYGRVWKVVFSCSCVFLFEPSGQSTGNALTPGFLLKSNNKLSKNLAIKNFKSSLDTWNFP